jgi:hypothetical protein
MSICFRLNVVDVVVVAHNNVQKGQVSMSHSHSFPISTPHEHPSEKKKKNISEREEEQEEENGKVAPDTMYTVDIVTVINIFCLQME